MTRSKSNMFSKHASSSRNYSDQKRRLILPHDILQEMRAGEQLVFVQGRRPEMVAKTGANRFAKQAS